MRTRVLTLTLTLAVAPALALEEYVRLSTADSLRLAPWATERLLWKSGFECPYTLLSPLAKEIKGVLLCFHGWGDNPSNFRKVVGRLGIQDVRCVIPRAPFPVTVEVGSPSDSLLQVFLGYSWTCPESVWSDGGVAFSVLVASRVLSQAVPSLGPVPPLVVMGFGQGALLSLLWAASSGWKPSALVAVLGRPDPHVQHALEAPWLSLEGTRCAVFSPPPADSSASWWEPALRLGARVEVVRMEGLELQEHHWAAMASFVSSSLRVRSP